MKCLAWINRMVDLSDRDCYLLHGGNIVAGTVLFVVFCWTVPPWALVLYSLLYGAALLNSILGILVRREIRAWESAQAVDGPGPPVVQDPPQGDAA